MNWPVSGGGGGAGRGGGSGGAGRQYGVRNGVSCLQGCLVGVGGSISLKVGGILITEV